MIADLRAHLRIGEQLLGAAHQAALQHVEAEMIRCQICTTTAGGTVPLSSSGASAGSPNSRAG